MPLTRRDFAKLGTLTLAARFAPAIHAQASPAQQGVPTDRSSSLGRKVGYAVIGLGPHCPLSTVHYSLLFLTAF